MPDGVCVGSLVVVFEGLAVTVEMSVTVLGATLGEEFSVIHTSTTLVVTGLVTIDMTVSVALLLIDVIRVVGWEDLNEVRNLRPSFNTPLGIWGGIAYSGIDSLLLKGRTPWTFRNKTKLTDSQHTKKARYTCFRCNFTSISLPYFDIHSISSECKPINYPAPQAPLSTDILTSVALTGTNHTEDQPIHLRLPPGTASRSAHVKKNVEEYAGLLGRACPAAVYEYVDADGLEGTSEGGGFGGKKLVINSQVCFHLGACSYVS